MSKTDYYTQAARAQYREYERAQKEQMREYNRQQREIQKEANRQEKAYNREVNKLQKAEQKRIERGQAVLQSVQGGSLTTNDLIVLGFNANIIKAASAVISYMSNYGVNKFDHLTIAKCLYDIYRIDVTNQVNTVGIVMYLIKVKRTQLDKELAFALRKVRSAKEFDSNDAEILHATDVLVRHYIYIYKHFGVGRNKISNRELIKPISLNRLTKLVMVDGIQNSIFDIYNSSRYMNLNDKVYIMIDNNGTNTTIKTNRMPVLGYGIRPKVDGVGEIKTINVKSYDNSGNFKTEQAKVVSINNKYVRMLNRYAIYVSTRKPGSHCGMVEIICAGGTRIYVYADICNDRDIANKSDTGARIYDYGYFEKDLQKKLYNICSRVNKQYGGVLFVRFKPVEQFKTKLIPIQYKQDIIRSEIMKQDVEEVY